ncbi:aminotransferase class I/II-fold pyridoxal phosphate-dependent enzyme [Pseudofulvibacter geojedonensis]|uniref:Aminotransferase class I/II-fold pyridoxal phosphate-dependent enzyme n=1 Tax=Pseudofulvibacter geojedonensis TaxID=1123758 RepID=A0ABW3I4J1_9FLAO
MSTSIDTLNQIITDGNLRKLVHNYTQDDHFNHHAEVTIDNEKLINFGSCSYLGLENNEQLKEGVIDAVKKYGTQFSSSRTYLSIGLYQELEHKLQRIFKKPLIVTASTTLGHLATIPTIIGTNDAVILDLQAHSSMQMTAQLLKAKKIQLYVIKHNCMESLEQKLKALNNKYDKIWYLADGVYSMYGDFAPFNELTQLLNKYKKFHLYIDDAHGMSWCGKNGEGVVKSNMPHHDRMVLAISLNKSFAAAGGCIVFPNTEMEELVRNCGSTYIFCGPIQPPMLGAALASVNLHLDPNFSQKQEELKKLIEYTNNLLDQYQLPQFMKTESPLFFIPVGLPKFTSDIVNNMKKDGFYLNPASFPAVPMKKSGVRFMITSKLTKKDIFRMIESLHYHFTKSIEESGKTFDEVAKIFGIKKFRSNSVEQKYNNTDLTIEINNSIGELNKDLWSTKFCNNGNLSYDNLALLEKTFSNNDLKENNWLFKYITIKDNDEIILQTFITVSISKDDMLLPKNISEKIEAERISNPYYLTSKTIQTGSPLTKGSHIYINKNSNNQSEAIEQLIAYLNGLQKEVKASSIMIRDFYNELDSELEKSMLDIGFTSYQLLNNLYVDEYNWNTKEDYLKKLNQKNRYSVKKEIIKYENCFEIEYSKPNSKLELEQCYSLYEQVYNKSLDLNVFKLPFEYFENMCNLNEYDFIKLYLKPEHCKNEQKELVGVLFSHINAQTYNALIVGLNYEYNYKFNVYKQILFKSILRSKQLNCKKLDLAFTAELEKRKIGAKKQKVYAFVQAHEHFNFSVLENMY